MADEEGEEMNLYEYLDKHNILVWTALIMTYVLIVLIYDDISSRRPSK